jgi:hypothetical protein
LTRRLKLLPAIVAFAAVGLTASAALASDAYPSSNCFRARDWQDWKAPAPNVLLVKVGASQIWRLDLSQGSDQLKYSDVRITNRNMHSAWLCNPLDFDLMLSDGHGVIHQQLIVASVRQLNPEEIAAIAPRDRP